MTERSDEPFRLTPGGPLLVLPGHRRRSRAEDPGDEDPGDLGDRPEHDEPD